MGVEIKPECTTTGKDLPPDDGVTVLLVDDDPDCRMLVRDAIADSGTHNRVFEVSTAEEAWRFLNRLPPFTDAVRPSLIYLDVEMPGLDGLGLLKQIKTDPDLRQITTVMMTGVNDERYIRLARAAGANSYTVKPANAEEFLRTVTDSTNYWLTVNQYPPETR